MESQELLQRRVSNASMNCHIPFGSKYSVLLIAGVIPVNWRFTLRKIIKRNDFQSPNETFNSSGLSYLQIGVQMKNFARWCESSMAVRLDSLSRCMCFEVIVLTSTFGEL